LKFIVENGADSKATTINPTIKMALNAIAAIITVFFLIGLIGVGGGGGGK
jgi:hypothetical protein